MSQNNTSNFVGLSKNPFFDGMPQTQENNKNQNNDLFINNNPFSKHNINIDSLYNNNIPNQYNNHSSEKSIDNSQKKFVNEKNNAYTPGTNINNPRTSNNFINLNNNINCNKSQNDIIFSEDLNKNNNNINFTESYKQSDNNSLNFSRINNILADVSSFNNIESNKMIVLGTKKINNNDFNNKKILNLPLYDNQTNELNINNLNKMIENNNNSKRKGSPSSSFNSNLDIIKEEQNESDKKSENEIKKNFLSDNKINIIKYDKELISIEKIINESINEEELQKIVNANNADVNSLLNDYNSIIINGIVDIDMNIFKNKINEFITYSKHNIEKLIILDNICDKIKEKIISSYKIKQEMQENKIDEYKKLKEYEDKLDYVISIQNLLIKELEDMNIQMIRNIKEPKIKNEVLINGNDIINYCDNVEIKLQKLNNLINNNFSCDNDLSCIEENIINESININGNISFFEIIDNIYNQIKHINKKYLKISLKNANIKNQNI